MPEVEVRGSVIAAVNAFTPVPFACSWWLRSSGEAWVHVAGEVDLCTAGEFRRTLAEAQRSSRRTVLDLDGLSFIDSSGVDAILESAREARDSGGSLLLTHAHGQVNRMLTLTRVGEQVPICTPIK